MSPQLYNQLTFVNGFTNLNGDSYQKHIIIALGKYLSDAVKENILKTKNIEDALKLINISYTHDYQNSQNFLKN